MRLFGKEVETEKGRRPSPAPAPHLVLRPQIADFRTPRQIQEHGVCSAVKLPRERGHRLPIRLVDRAPDGDIQVLLFKNASQRLPETKADDQRDALTVSRATLLASMNFVEAYLNGLAYDCFHRHHDALPIDEHDLLAGRVGQREEAAAIRRFQGKGFSVSGGRRANARGGGRLERV